MSERRDEERLAEVSRLNGMKSKGPVTEEGKARSAMNAWKHGRYAKPVTVMEVEDGTAFLDLLDAYREQFRPQSPVEARLVNEVAHIDWTLTRCRALEVAHLNRTVGLAGEIGDLEQMTAALAADVNDSRFPTYIAVRIRHLLAERDNAMRTLRAMRRQAPTMQRVALELMQAEEEEAA